jgi:hypothetical protein
MRKHFILLAWAVFVVSCGVKPGKTEHMPSVPMAGTWKLLSGTLIEAGDTMVTDYTKNMSFIKIINASHFAFLQHDLSQGKDTTAAFVAGGGRYTLTDSLYTEHLEYCSDRAWEGNDFSFTVTVKNDTLIQQGVERVQEAGVNRLNIEKYVRIAP